MKKLIATTIVAGFAVGAFAQATSGSLQWGNQFGSTFIQPIYAPSPLTPDVQVTGASALGKGPTGTTVYTGALLSGTGYTMGLFVAANNVTDSTLFTLVGTSPFRTGANLAATPNGLVSPATVTFDGLSGRPTYLAGSTINFFVAAWDNLGGTFNPANYFDVINSSGAHGRGAITLSGALGGTDAGGAPVVTPSSAGWVSFSLIGGAAPVPEPSTFALAGLGLAGLMIFRRRK